MNAITEKDVKRLWVEKDSLFDNGLVETGRGRVLKAGQYLTIWSKNYIYGINSYVQAYFIPRNV